MQTVLEWLGKEVPSRKTPWFIFKILCLNFAYLFVLAIVLKILRIALPPLPREEPFPILVWSFPPMLTFGVFLEELIFRFAPLLPVTLMWGNSKKTLAVAAIVSILFGLAHGQWYCLFIQAVAGMLFSFVFLKCGGLHKRYGRALLSSTAVHLAYDVIVALLVLAGGGRTL